MNCFNAFTDTKHTLLWQNWQAIAQSISLITEPYLDQATLATDSDIKKQMKADGTANQAVAIKIDESGLKAGVRVARQRLRSTRSKHELQSDLLMKESRSMRNQEQ